MSEKVIDAPSQNTTPLLDQTENGVHSTVRVLEHPNSLPVAQLSVEATETRQFQHNIGSSYTRSVSMPLPGNPTDSALMASASQNTTPHSPTQAATFSDQRVLNAAAKLESLKNWSISTYKCTKQLISEKLGKSTRTTDVEIESQIENLRDIQRKYLNILRLARALSSHFQHVVATQVCEKL